MHPFLSWQNWILPVIVVVLYSILLIKVSKRMPKIVGSTTAWIGGGLSTLFWFTIFGTVGTGSAALPWWIAGMAVMAQMFSVTSDYELKGALYSKIAGPIALTGQLYMFLILLGITVTGIIIPPQLGAMIPLSQAFSIEKLILPILITVIAVLILILVKMPKGIAKGVTLVAPVMWIIYWLMADYGATVGTVVVPIQFAILPIFASMVGMLSNYVVEEDWTPKLGASVCLLTTAFFSLWFAGIHL